MVLQNRQGTFLANLDLATEGANRSLADQKHQTIRSLFS
jgi:hypothetical protein